MAETTGLLDQSLGPILQTWESLPIYGKIAVGGIAITGFLGYHWLQNRDEEKTLNATDWGEKWENMVKSPAENTGGKENTLLYKQSNSATKRTIGVIKKVDETKTYIGSSALFDSIADPDKKPDLEKSGELDVVAATYAVVKGGKKLDRIINTVIYKIAGMFSKGSNPQAEYFDLPLNTIKVTDQGIMIKPHVHLFKKDGLWQTATTAGQNRLYQLSWLDTHQNWQESLQKHPEFYSDLNMDTSSKKNIMNTKDANIKESMKAKERKEKKEAME